MKIKFIEIENFRKLKSCRIEFGEKETVLVGANNSGKTSAIDALILFLKQTRQKEITTTDITLSNWSAINKIGEGWINCTDLKKLNLDINQWHLLFPSIDIWIDVNVDQIHYVSHIIPTLSWTGGILGVRLSFEPKDIEKLYKEFNEAFNSATETASKNSSKTKLTLWPQSLNEFLEKRLHGHFAVKSYLLDPSKLSDPLNGVANLQKLPDSIVPLEADPFKGLIKIDVINAQRGFSDAKTSDTPNSGNTVGNLSNQLRGYFDKHLNPTEQPTVDDLDALTAIENAKNEFDKKLKTSFSSAISELESLGYPGLSDPQITLTSKINPIDGLNHDSAVKFSITKENNTSKESALFLPEKYNGLGYQNLVSMVFKLIRFRDEWMRKGKAAKSLDADDSIIEPLHLVFIEEPEAHLHAQVQQVFIKKAYNVLRNYKDLKASEKHSTQMIVSTHSNHIAHEIDFGCLRYFRKSPSNNIKNEVPKATVVNLSKTFGQNDETSKFATRYLKTTHCDLFFADAVILVEGTAERILFPHLISQKYPGLDSRYISILEIGGSHAHKLRPLIEDLGLITLVITDIDSIKSDSVAKVQPVRKRSYKSGNFTLKNWIPQKEDLDELLNLSMDNKVTENTLVRVAYQYPFDISWNGDNQEVIPYTFEDALTFSNVELFKTLIESTGLIKKMSEALSKSTLSEAMTAMFDALGSGKKAEMALDLLYIPEPSRIEPPKYIAEGLEWLEDKLKNKDNDFIDSDTTSQEVVNE